MPGARPAGVVTSMGMGTLSPRTGVAPRPPAPDPGRPARHRRHLAGGIALVLAVAVVAVAAPRYTAAPSAAPQGSVTPAPKPGSAGTTVGGVRCAPGVRQVPFSDYSPICLPAWHGDNGGATANGVTRTTITLTYREAATNILAALYLLLPPSVVGTNAEAIHTMDSYISVFNRYFELYGRKVVLEPFEGQGDFVDEDEGTGLAAAQEDALTVADSIHAFADMSLVDSSAVYDDALQQAGVSVFSLYLNDSSWYRQAAPYQYTVGPTCSQSDEALADVLASPGMADADAAYAGPALRQHKRVYGIVYPDNAQADACAQQLSSALAAAGHPAAASVSFEFDVSQLATEAQNAVGQLQSKGVTTIVCAECDPVSPIYFLKSAKDAGYFPEFVVQSYFAGGTASIDGFIQNVLAQSGAEDEAGGILALGTGGKVTLASEALKVYEMANHGSLAGILPSYLWAYESLLYFYDLLQAAGPDLTPATLHRALADTAELVPSKAGGTLGRWTFGAGTVAPSSSFQLVHWVADATSPENGRKGTFEPCYGGRTFSFGAPHGGVPQHTGPACPT